MNEGVQNHVASEGGPEEEEGVGGDTDADVQLDEAAEVTAGGEAASKRERTDALKRDEDEAPRSEWARSPKTIPLRVTESLTTEGTDDESLNDGLEGLCERSVRPKSLGRSLGTGDDSKLRPKGLGAAHMAADRGEDPPVDWLEPLEEDDDDNYDEEDDDDDDDDDDDAMGRAGTWTCCRGTEDEREQGGGRGEPGGREREEQQRGRKGVGRKRRRQAVVDEDWEDWPILGKGWKRKEVFRRSGFSMGKTDTYYMSPYGERLRSKIELAKNLAGTMDISTFDFKSGKFLDSGTIRRMRKFRKQRKMRDNSEAVDTDDGYSLNSAPHSQKQHPAAQRARTSQQKNPSSYSTPPRPSSTGDASGSPHGLRKLSPLCPSSASSSPSREASFPAPAPSRLAPLLAPVSLTSTPHLRFDGDLQGMDALRSTRTFQQQRPRSQERTFKKEAEPLDCAPAELLVSECSNCGSPVEGVALWKKSRTSLCQRCTTEKRTEDSRNIIFRKWLPCGQCRACLVTEDCGMCASCRSGQVNHKLRKPVRCRKRKCLCPIRKKTAKEGYHEKEINKIVKVEGQCMNSSMNKVTRYSRHKENSGFTVHHYGEDEDCDDEDGNDLEDGLRKRSWRGCGACSGCLRTTDCGSCDFCTDKPKLGGSNRKRQKCRLRQCLTQATDCAENPGQGPKIPLNSHRKNSSSHAAGPTQRRYASYRFARSGYRTHEGWVGLGRPRPHYRYPCQQQTKAFWEDLEFTDDDDDDDEDYVSGGKPSGYNPEQKADKDGVSWTSQNCLKTDSGKIDIAKNQRLPSRIPDPSERPFTPPQGSDVPYCSSDLAAGSGSGERWGLKDRPRPDGGLDIVEVDAGELETTPMISEIFSLAEGSHAGNGADLPSDPELLSLLEALRRMELPSHWVGLLVDGPSLQLLQCSRHSTMADTTLYIDSGFYYQINVQDQPLLLTHPIYKDHPRRLPTVAHVVALLLDLERYAVCRGLPASPSQPRKQEVIVPTRAAICQFLVLKTEERCDKCRVAPQVQ
ncbi:hypothetical protein AGOR_G00066560 [Albula goreensis]|uniref:Methyl-CpG-binding domain protein 1 n=1 Tax=Albula goreensis TaxID=1534307 RepID=A0A8T3DS00_9TELE|nr:hypothetical protein AGOR_G00066560 [Albula goreensis]